MNAVADTLPALLAVNAGRLGAKPALVGTDATITHVALHEKSRRLGGQLVAAGVGRGSRVGILMPNGVEWAVVAAATWCAGATVVPLSTLMRPPELEAQLRLAAVTHLVTVRTFRGRDYLDDLENVAPGVRDLTVSRRRHPTLPALRAVWTADAIPAPTVGPAVVDALAGTVRPADDLVVLFTSGSRGQPKGTVHTHGGALRAVASGLGARCVGPDERLYIPMPFFWTGGLAGGLLTALVAGATLLTEAVPEAEPTLHLLEQERATLFRGWPDQAAKLAAHPRFADADLTALRDGSLAAVLPPARRPEPGARANLFGMTETFGPYCGSRADHDLPRDAWGSCGRPFAGIAVRIVVPESGAECAPGALGEIEVRGPNLMRAIRGRLRSASFTPDGGYRTGDLGVVDDRGYLWYHGRRDDMFKVSGATVFPDEVAAALRTIAGVRQAHVTDVFGDDGATLVGALVVGDIGVEDLARDAGARLSAFKVPSRWLVTDSIATVPVTATGKVDKPTLQALLAKSGLSAGRQTPPKEHRPT